jgi:hypothetical protein
MSFIRLLFINIFLVIAGSYAFADANWVDTEGTIQNVAKVAENQYKYDVVYNIKTSEHVGDEDRYVKNPVEHTISDAKLAPVEGQKIKLHYKVNAPEEYELLAPIQYQKKVK